MRQLHSALHVAEVLLMGNKGALLRRMGQLNKSELLIRQTIVAGEALIRRFPSIIDYRTLLAQKYLDLGLCLRDQNHLEEAEKTMREAWQRFAVLARALPQNHKDRRWSGRAQYNLGEILFHQGRIDEATANFQEAIKYQEAILCQRSLKTDHR